MIHQTKVTFVIRVETPWSWTLCRVTIDIWVTLTEVTERQTATLKSHRMWKWTKNSSPHYLDLTILNSHILLLVWFWTFTQRLQTDICEEKVELAGPQPRPIQTVGRPSALTTGIVCLVKNSRWHSPTKPKERIDCVLCHAHIKNVKPNSAKCKKCKTGLCISICFKVYRTNTQFYVVSHNKGSREGVPWRTSDVTVTWCKQTRRLGLMTSWRSVYTYMSDDLYSGGEVVSTNMANDLIVPTLTKLQPLICNQMT